VPGTTADLKLTEFIVSLAANVAFLVIVTLARRLDFVLKRRDPRRRKVGLAIVGLLWIAGNIAFFLLDLPFHSLFLFITALICGWALYSELAQFWRIDLVGADARISHGIDPKQSLEMCTTSLSFLGIGASKLTCLQPVFQEAVARCDQPGRPIRFLLSDPDNDELLRVAKKAGRNEGAYRERVHDSLRVIARLRNQEKNIEVRFYRDFPAFRLMIINEEVILASHYVLGKGDGEEMPQLHIVRKSASRDTTSLYYAFQQYFDSIWADSKEWDFNSLL
jgi:hypothetical protein